MISFSKGAVYRILVVTAILALSIPVHGMDSGKNADQILVAVSDHLFEQKIYLEQGLPLPNADEVVSRIEGMLDEGVASGELQRVTIELKLDGLSRGEYERWVKFHALLAAKYGQAVAILFLGRNPFQVGDPEEGDRRTVYVPRIFRDQFLSLADIYTIVESKELEELAD